MPPRPRNQSASRRAETIPPPRAPDGHGPRKPEGKPESASARIVAARAGGSHGGDVMRKHEARQLLKLAQALVRGLLRYQYSSSTAGDLSGDPRFVDRYRVQKPVYEKLPEIEAPPGEGTPLRETHSATQSSRAYTGRPIHQARGPPQNTGKMLRSQNTEGPRRLRRRSTQDDDLASAAAVR
ncbi:hypothetical protein HPB50_020068 [Hyalomma asiaticum]|uniref:Uncharacterized protein n=1 Tax=Hyalomma asiaticum TaxID=266040 RepID=A0ACB7SDR7_HYAAI|nr:hypothetical protein HPB50_020068 [Hyalomma asiaticum]